ncbi:hypothetical protein TNCT_238461 [Trichonephila clavata]|uniref:Uncharacterized protein n=1 Tax=Trichonephila clavata TaxID=2740835 RepID=A0A8X6GDS6_TRICU|nr:hypothetical protein TNCT_2901 [Trichonephila clavata]GFR01918.1 hypothetical protein TNCT_238461 [Trichonephila clavata]
MENKPGPEEPATSNDKAKNSKSAPVPPNERPTEEFIADNAAEISELLKLRAAYAAGSRKIAIIRSTEMSTANSKVNSKPSTTNLLPLEIL